MPTFLTATDIDHLARQGQRTLILKPEMRLTPLGWDRVRELGMEVRAEEQTGPRTPPGYTYPPADEALPAFLATLHELREALAPAPVLARWVEAIIRAVEGGPSIPMPSRVQLAMHGFSLTKRRQLLIPVEILLLWAPRLFGPRAPHRRYDILWSLTELHQCLSKPS